MQKILVIGGRFDPIHIGHLIIAEDMKEELNVDKVFFIPSYNPPHRGVETPFEHRYNMVKLAIDEEPSFAVSDIEKRLGLEKSYSYLVMQEFKKQFPDSRILFLIGSDQFKTFKTWYKYEDLLNLVEVVVALRNTADKKYYPKDLIERVKFAHNRIIEVSASEVRRRAREGKPFRFMVREPVYQYILENNLYREAK